MDNDTKTLGDTKASKGGKARAANLSPEERQESARKAAMARWGNRAILKATHMGEIRLGEVILPCAVLEDGRRVVSQIGVTKTIGGSKAGRDNSPSLPPFLSANNIKPFISNELATALAEPIVYQTLGNHGGGNQANGIEAKYLPDICNVWLSAREEKILAPNQLNVAQRAELMVRSLAKVGIVALIDEATGYQDDRARDELARLLQAYVAEELRPWVKLFPHSFYKQVYRLYGWKYTDGNNHHPQQMGRFIHDYVYKALPEPVLPELKKRNPVTDAGYRKYKHHQFLTEDIGVPGLSSVIIQVTTVLKLSKSKAHFKKQYDQTFHDLVDQQCDLELGED